MTAQPLDEMQIDRPLASSRSLWDTLTQPASLLNTNDKPKARLLSAVLVVFLPLAFLAVFINPVTSIIAGREFTPPNPGIFVALLIIPVAYVLSRTRYYSVGAWLTISVPMIAVVLPILSTGQLATVVSLFYLALAVIMAELLLSSRETLIIGIIAALLVVLVPQFRLAGGLPSEAWAVFSFVLVTTGITVLVGRIREDNLRQLEKTQLELLKSLDEKEKSRIQAEQSRERAERSEQVKAAFLASMSHELRTPLNAVINFTRFVLDGDTGPVNEQQQDLLGEVVGSAKHLLNLINDVLDMSKIEAGSLTLFIEDGISLNQMLTSVASTGRSLLGDKPVSLELKVDENLPLLRCDRQRILQILLNVISNACKFTEAGTITINAQAANGEIVIAVKDTGPGIAQEDQAMVFEAFKQTKSGLRQAGGTGLGMPIAQSLAEAHNGRLWLESEFGKGTTFSIALPIKSEALVPAI
ncbi:MAG: HAMP domain-containing histidine kinase [Anaerolineae bacterium]|nr:HAMP domain-containing histidine kinase [Anaerolineae bacterium]